MFNFIEKYDKIASKVGMLQTKLIHVKIKSDKDNFVRTLTDSQLKVLEALPIDSIQHGGESKGKFHQQDDTVLDRIPCLMKKDRVCENLITTI